MPLVLATLHIRAGGQLPITVSMNNFLRVTDQMYKFGLAKNYTCSQNVMAHSETRTNKLTADKFTFKFGGDNLET